MGRNRKYARLGQTAVASQCGNSKCNWQGLDESKAKKKVDSITTIDICPKCGNEWFHGLLEMPKKLKAESHAPTH